MSDSPTPPQAAAPTLEDLSHQGAAALSGGRYLEAAERYRAALAVSPRSVDARLGLAHALEAAERLDDALVVLDDGITHAADQTEFLAMRGSIRSRLNRYDDAELDLRRVIRLHPAHGPALLELGSLLLRRGLAADAADIFERAVTVQPDRAQAYLLLAEARNRAGDADAAIVALERATQLDDSLSHAWQLWGRALDRLGRPHEAEAMYRRAQELGR